VSGCSEEKPKPLAGDSATSENDDDDDGLSADDDDTDDDDSDDFVDDEFVEDDEGPELTLEDIIKQCGVSPEDLENPDAVIMDKQLRSWPKVFTGTEAAPIVGNVNYRVTVTTLIQVKATMSQVRMVTDFDVTAEPSLAEGEAMAKVAPNRGASVSTVLTTEERLELTGDNKEWGGIVCTVQPVSELITDKGGFQKKVRFTPALPMSISPKADAPRYEAEIGEGRVFTNIEAEVVSSNDPANPVGKKVTGTVTIKKVNPNLTLSVGGETEKTLKSDIAYKVEFDFGSVEQTVGLGLMPSQTNFISHQTRDFKVIVAETGFKEAGTDVLSDEL
jgi:hypothetical protein